MTTLNNDQAKFLADYTLLLISDEVNEKLNANRETDEWKEAVEEGKVDEETLESVEIRKAQLKKDSSLKVLQDKIQKIDENYFIGQHYVDDYDGTVVESLYIPERTDEEIEKLVQNYLDSLAESYAIRKTGFITNYHGYNKPLSRIRDEVYARLSIEPLGNFDDTVASLMARFDLNDTVQKIVANHKQSA